MENLEDYTLWQSIDNETWWQLRSHPESDAAYWRAVGNHLWQASVREAEKAAEWASLFSPEAVAERAARHKEARLIRQAEFEEEQQRKRAEWEAE